MVKTRIIRGFQKRPALLRRVMSRARHLPVRTPAGIYLDTQPAFEFDRPRVQAVIDKIVRGLYLHCTGRHLTKDCIVQDFLLNPHLSPEFQREICKLPLRDVGDGSVFSYRFIESDDVHSVSFWFLMFFNRTLFVTLAEPNPLVERDAP